MKRVFKTPIPLEVYQKCSRSGMTQADCARELGVSRAAVSMAAKKHGLIFTDGKRDERAIARAKQLIRKAQTPEARLKMRLTMMEVHSDPVRSRSLTSAANAAQKAWFADPVNNPLVLLTPEQRADYDNIKRKTKRPRDEVFAMIGRSDLIAREDE